jgi:hypothetical protein
MLIQARASLSKPTVPSVAYRTRYAKVYGTMYPKHVGTTRVYFERYEAYKGKYSWRVKFYKTASLSSYYSAERYTVSLKFPYTGKWRARVYHADASHYASYGAYSNTITVR